MKNKKRNLPTHVYCIKSIVLLLSAVVLMVSCEKDPEPVGRFSVEPQKISIGYPEIEELKFTWEPLISLGDFQGRIIVFVHLLDANGEIVRTFDHNYEDPWQPGTSIEYVFEIGQSGLSNPLEPGSYTLTAGLYDPNSKQRWPLIFQGEVLGKYEYKIADIEIASKNGGVNVVFNGDWSAIDLGKDRQVLARRWAFGNAKIHLSNITEPGTAHLVVVVPQWAMDLESEAELRIQAKCSQTEKVITGAGRMKIAFPGIGVEGGQDCEIEIAPQYVFPFQEISDEQEIGLFCLESISWKPN